jgi:hypothetical protein
MKSIINKEDIKRESLKIETIGSRSTQIEYTDRDKAFDYYYEQLKDKIIEWSEHINNEHQIKNMRNSEDYAFVHFLAKKMYPEEYTNDVGVELIKPCILKHFNINAEEYMKMQANKDIYEVMYSETLLDLINMELNENVLNFTKNNELINEYKTTPIVEHESVIEKWIEIFSEETLFIAESILIAASRIISRNALSNLSLKLECSE